MKGIILQDYSPQGGFTTWLAFLTARTRRRMYYAEVVTAFKDQFGQAPEVVRRLPGHWRVGPLTTQMKEQLNEEKAR